MTGKVKFCGFMEWNLVGISFFAINEAPTPCKPLLFRYY
ncbi:hypothetical protein bcf_25665 [Bacillus cereus F837/76]|nr:hypothetical protein bcf_25665 [Bacillus cereus F837/76]